MSTLVEFLLARYTEDEEEADWRHAHDCGTNSGFPCDCGHPAHLLAQINANRQIVDLNTSPFDRAAAIAEELGEQWVQLTDDHQTLTRADYLRQQRILRALATPYAAHQDYRPEWSA